MSRWLAVLLLCSALSCKGESGDEAEPPEQKIELGEIEAQRGRKACDAYKQKVCACAEKLAEAELSRQCRLADVRIEALDTQMRVLSAPGDMDKRDRAVVFAEVRKVIKGCFQDAAALDSKCPESTPPPSE